MDDDNVVGIYYGGGLTSFDGVNWNTFDIYNSSLSSNTIFDIFITPENILWLGTYSGGLVKFDGIKQWITFNMSNSGIAANTVNCIAQDSSGHIWIGHPFEGLSIYRKGGVLLPGFGNNSDLTFELLPNFPNPFNNATTIAFSLVKAAHVTINIYNILGQQVASLCDKDYAAGIYRLQWYGRNNAGAVLPGGVYFYSLKTNDRHVTKKMLLLR